MSIEQVRIEFSDGGSTDRVISRVDVLGKEIDKTKAKANGSGAEVIGKQAAAAAPKVDLLSAALRTLVLYLGARELVQASDTFTNLQNKLRLITGSQTELNQTFNRLLGLANETRGSLEGTVTLYQRFAVSSKELGVSQNELFEITQTVNKAIQLSGVTAIEAKQGMLQLAQGLASGVLRGDELRAVLEELPAVADIIAKQMGVTRGRLRELGEQGAITSKIIIDAFRAAGPEIAEKFAKTIPTISQAFQILGNQFINAVGQLNTATGAFTLFSQTIIFVANHIVGVLIPAITVLTSVAIVKLTAAVRALSEEAIVKLIANLKLLTKASLIGLIIGAVYEVTKAFESWNAVAEIGFNDILLALEPVIRGTWILVGAIKALADVVTNLSFDAFDKSLDDTKKQMDTFFKDLKKDQLARIVEKSQRGSSEGPNALTAAEPAILGAQKTLDELRQQVELERELIGVVGVERRIQEDVGKIKLDLVKQHTNLLQENAKVLLKNAEALIRERDLLEGRAKFNQAIAAKKEELATEQRLIGLTGTEARVQQELGLLKESLGKKNVELLDEQGQRQLKLVELIIRQTEELKTRSTLRETLRGKTDELVTEQKLIGVLGIERTVSEEVGRIRQQLIRKHIDLNEEWAQIMLTNLERETQQVEVLKAQAQIEAGLQQKRDSLDVQKQTVGLSGAELEIKEALLQATVDEKNAGSDLLDQQVKARIAEAAAIARATAELKARDALIRGNTDLANQVDLQRSLVGLTGEEMRIQEEMGKLKIELGQQVSDITEKELQAKLKKREADLRELADLKLKADILDRIQQRDQGQVQNLRVIKELYADGSINVIQYAEELENAGIKSDEFAAGLGAVGAELKHVDTSVNALGKSIGQDLVGAVDKASDAIAAFAVSGFRNTQDLRKAFSELFTSLGQQILATIIKMLILRAVEAGLGGLLGSPTGAVSSIAATNGLASATGNYQLPNHALGGGVLGGRPILVGERGPEIWTPPGTGMGHIVPNSQIGAGPAPVNVSIINVRDANEVPNAIVSGPGERAVLNVINKNRSAIARSLN